jgi:hypothetical protein
MSQTTSDPFRAYAPDELGSDGYPPEWHEIIKHAVRGDAGQRCVRCGHPYRRGEHGSGEWSPCDVACSHLGPVRWRVDDLDPWTYENADEEPGRLIHDGVAPGFVIEARYRILTVHHLDGNKANCRWWNLAALCQRCHLTIQGRVQMARVYPWEHSPWFRPYVAGYYAFVYLGEDLDRPTVEARMVELLALEHMA